MDWTRRQTLAGLASAGISGAHSAVHAAQPGQWYAPAPVKDGLKLTDEQRAAARRFLGRYPSVDIHCHPGRFFLRGVTNPSERLKAYGQPFEGNASREMAAGGVSAGLFSAVADMSILEFSRERGLYAFRQFAPGEAWRDYLRQIRTLQQMVRSRLVASGRAPNDILRAHRQGRTAAVFAIEGGDFIEDRLERIERAHADGVRSITIVHYHVNQIGDIQTAPAHHGGLTPLGRDIVRAMNRAGIIVDLAHAPVSVVRGAVDVSTQPMMISHTNLTRPGLEHPRLVSAEMARLVTSHGGIVGSVPSGIGQSDFEQWIESILRMVDQLGVDHVAIGTDMDANYLPVFTTYRDWPSIPAALAAHGLAEREIAKIMGENFIRLFNTAAATSRVRG